MAGTPNTPCGTAVRACVQGFSWFWEHVVDVGGGEMDLGGWITQCPCEMEHVMDLVGALNNLLWNGSISLHVLVCGTI